MFLQQDPSAHPRSAHTLDVVERFLNTLDLRTFEGARRGPNGLEEIPDARALARWMAAEHLIASGKRASETELHEAHALRAALRAALASRDNAQLVTTSSRAIERFRLSVAIDGRGVPILVSAAPKGTVEAGLAQLVCCVAVASARGEWERLRACAADDCGWVFYDRSKPGTGRWCSMRVCGNRAKTRAYRASRSSE